MIQFSNLDVYGWETAMRGMRNPLNSWEKSDSIFGIDGDVVIGPNDKKLMMNLASAGSDHAKYKRMIQVSMDIVAPLYWWKEFDTYKVGTVANSCSTMHKIHEKEFTIDDFSHEYLYKKEDCFYGDMVSYAYLEMTISVLNYYRDRYNISKHKKDWYQMIQLLPSSYNQKRTVMVNYEVLSNIHHSRRTHKLDEWREFCLMIESLPYSEIIDPLIRSIKSTKKGIENFLTGSLLEVRPMTIDKPQGLRPKISIIDEWLSGDILEDVVGAGEGKDDV